MSNRQRAMATTKDLEDRALPCITCNGVSADVLSTTGNTRPTMQVYRPIMRDLATRNVRPTCTSIQQVACTPSACGEVYASQITCGTVRAGFWTNSARCIYSNTQRAHCVHTLQKQQCIISPHAKVSSRSATHTTAITQVLADLVRCTYQQTVPAVFTVFNTW